MLLSRDVLIIGGMDLSLSEDSVRHLQERAISSIRKLRQLELSMLEAEILDNLMDGRKNAVELVDCIYGLARGHEGFDASCIKVRRSLKGLERRGFISTGIFGREKPYRLTQHGVAVLSSIAPEMDTPKILHVHEIISFVATGVVGIIVLASAWGALGSQDRILGGLVFAAFYILLGYSLAMLVQAIRRVF